MGSDMEFGPDTENIRRWLEKRQTYKSDGGKHRGAEPAEEAVFVTAPSPTSSPTPRRAASTAPSAATSAATNPAPSPDSRVAARSVLEALGAVGPPPVAGPTTPSAPAAPAEPAAEPEPASAAHRAEAPAPGSSGRTTDVTFAPRNGLRHAMSFALFGVVLAAAAAGYYAYRDPSPGTYGVAATCAVLVLAVWAVRAGATTTNVRIFRGQLEIQRGGGLEVADLSNPHTPVAVLGTPGRRNWLVLVERPGRPLLEVDATLVEPHKFMDSLLRLRPDLRDWARANRPELLESMQSWNVF